MTLATPLAMTVNDDLPSRSAPDLLSASEARAEWLSLANEIGLAQDFSFEGLLDRLDRAVLNR